MLTFCFNSVQFQLVSRVNFSLGLLFENVSVLDLVFFLYKINLKKIQMCLTDISSVF